MITCPKERMNPIAEVLNEAKSLARRFRKLTGKPLGITGEVAEFSAAQILGLRRNMIQGTNFFLYVESSTTPNSSG
jgi:hypothetical protein